MENQIECKHKGEVKHCDQCLLEANAKIALVLGRYTDRLTYINRLACNDCKKVIARSESRYPITNFEVVKTIEVNNKEDIKNKFAEAYTMLQLRPEHKLGLTSRAYMVWKDYAIR